MTIPATNDFANISDAAMSRVGGVVLCGGQSTRMGRPKLSLPFGGELMLPRIVRILSQVVQPTVVVAAQDQELPPLPDNVLITRDDRPHDGPLRGICCGMERLQGLADAAYVSSCDVPLLRPEFIREMIARLGDYEIAVPDENGLVHPLAGVYRVALTTKAREILDAGDRRLLALIEESRSLRVDVSELQAVDPQLDSLRNLNTLADYDNAVSESRD